MKLEQPIWPRFLPERFVVNVATLGPIGRRLPAPGTWGSLAGLLYFTIFFFPLNTAWLLVGSLVVVPAVVPFLTSAASRLLRRFSATTGRLAGDAVRSNPRRSTINVMALLHLARKVTPAMDTSGTSIIGNARPGNTVSAPSMTRQPGWLLRHSSKIDLVM